MKNIIVKPLDFRWAPQSFLWRIEKKKRGRRDERPTHRHAVAGDVNLIIVADVY